MQTPIDPHWQQDAVPATSQVVSPYIPLSDTLRVYCGWVLAWYIALMSVSSLLRLRSIPTPWSFIDDLSGSVPLLVVSVGAFLFLLLSSLHRLFGRHTVVGFLLSFVWIVCVALFVTYN